MSRLPRSPRQEKDRDYARQSANAVRHATRRQQHGDKAAVHRRYRRAASLALAQPGPLADTALADTVTDRIATTRRDRDINWSGQPQMLSSHVTNRLVERFLDTVDTFSAGPYRPDSQRARVEQALAGILADRGRPDSWQIRSARELDELLPEPVYPGRWWRSHRNAERRREWFGAFLADRPEWELRLVRWISDRKPV